MYEWLRKLQKEENNSLWEAYRRLDKRFEELQKELTCLEDGGHDYAWHSTTGTFNNNHDLVFTYYYTCNECGRVRKCLEDKLSDEQIQWLKDNNYY